MVGTKQAAPVERRSRLGPERVAEILTASVVLLRAHGYDGLTMDAVGAAAQTSKATLYRVWGGKPGLVAAAVAALRPLDGSRIDTGSLAGDLHSLVEQMDARAIELQDLMISMLQAAARDPELERALADSLGAPFIGGVRAITDRAAARGEIVADHPALSWIAMTLVTTPLGIRMLLCRRAQLDDLHAVVDLVALPALRTPPAEG